MERFPDAPKQDVREEKPRKLSDAMEEGGAETLRALRERMQPLMTSFSNTLGRWFKIGLGAPRLVGYLGREAAVGRQETTQYLEERVRTVGDFLVDDFSREFSQLETRWQESIDRGNERIANVLGAIQEWGSAILEPGRAWYERQKERAGVLQQGAVGMREVVRTMQQAFREIREKREQRHSTEERQEPTLELHQSQILQNAEQLQEALGFAASAGETIPSEIANLREAAARKRRNADDLKVTKAEVAELLGRDNGGDLAQAA